MKTLMAWGDHQKGQGKAGPAQSDCSALLAAFTDAYRWLVDETAAMQKNRDQYPEIDHHGLPYALGVLKGIAKQANLHFDG